MKMMKGVLLCVLALALGRWARHFTIKILTPFPPPGDRRRRGMWTAGRRACARSIERLIVDVVVPNVVHTVVHNVVHNLCITLALFITYENPDLGFGGKSERWGPPAHCDGAKVATGSRGCHWQRQQGRMFISADLT